MLPTCQSSHVYNDQCILKLAERSNVMGEVHRLLDEKGRTGLLADPYLPFDRAVVEAASSYLTCEGNEIGYLYSGWAQ